MPEDEIVLREAQPGEVPEIVDLVNRAYGRTPDPAGWTSEDEILEGPRIQPEGLEELMQRTGSRVLVAERDGELVGCVHLQQLDGTDVELGLLSVDPTRQHEGLGRRILRAGEAEAEQVFDADRIVLKVLTVREELIGWYERRGYERTGKEQGFDPDGEQRSLVGPLAFEVLEKQLD